MKNPRLCDDCGAELLNGGVVVLPFDVYTMRDTRGLHSRVYCRGLHANARAELLKCERWQFDRSRLPAGYDETHVPQ